MTISLLMKKNILICQKLKYQIPNGDSIFEDLTFEIRENEFVGILGKNGAGKTTLIDLMMGHRPLTGGELLLFDESPMHSHRLYKNKIQVISNDIQIQKSLSVKEYLEFNSFFYPLYDKNKELELTRYFDINLNSKIGALSTGQRVKTMAILALSCCPDLIIMDEVTAVMDPLSRMFFLDLLRDIKQKKTCSVIFATNIAEDLLGTVDKVLFLENKKATIHSPEDIEKLFHLKNSTPHKLNLVRSSEDDEGIAV
jgi:ABC-2 type transport system ATP-binding protein